MKSLAKVFYIAILIFLTACGGSGGSDGGGGGGGGGGDPDNTDTKPTPEPDFLNTYSIFIKDSDGLALSDLSSDMGHALKILDTATRVVVIDYENSRILFYTKGDTLAESSIIKIVGTHSNVNNNAPFNPQSNNKLNSLFSGVIHKDELWVTNYTFGEILRFDLDGNYIESLPGKYKHLDSDKTTLFAFEGKSIYSYSESGKEFTYETDLPISVNVNIDDYLYRTGAIHVGYNRLGVLDRVNTTDTLRVFDLPALLLNDPVAEVLTVSNAKSFAILSNKIVYATGYTTDLAYCDLNGQNCGTGTFSPYLYSFRHNPGSNNMYVIGAWGIQVLDTQLNGTELISRSQYYWQGNFLGGDDKNLYFYDFHDGGFAIAPLNNQDHTAFVDSANEIAYSGWHLNVRIRSGFGFLQSEWPQDSYKMLLFDLTNKTSTDFSVPSKQGFDVDDDYLYVLNGLTIQVYTRQGNLDREITLSNLDNSNLQDFTTTSTGLFAKNSNNFFIGYNSKLNIFSLTGVFQENHELGFNSVTGKTMLFADNNRILLNSPLKIYDLSTHQVSNFPDSNAKSGGFVFENAYWYQSGYNEFTAVGY